MDQELSRLELKISRVVEQCALVRAENIDLRQQVASQNDEIKRLKEKLKESGDRVSRLVESLPG
jgi:septal ring factor EnvC (AmiA/AmiB activator)